MAYRATPNITTGYSPFFMLHGMEVTLPSKEELKARVTKADPSIKQRLNNLKVSLKQAYKALYEANRKSRQSISSIMTGRQNCAAIREGIKSFCITQQESQDYLGNFTNTGKDIIRLQQRFLYSTTKS